uniref:Uncharacterized protein n=1 Tax=Brassica oleracea var. oleracea TaxID=109376 RepID=A0A0D3BGQ4_BRAOL
MAPSTGIPNESRRRPRSTGLQLPDMRQGGPQLTLSEPFAIAPSSSPPISVPPGVVPPGSVPHASVGSSSAVPAAPAPYVRRREDALLHAPSRRNQPHLHPDKINGALWFGIDPEACWNFVPPEKKDQWWHAFIQHYYWEDQFHDEIYLKWKKQTQVTVCGRISQNRRDNRQPSYMSDAHWATMVEKYNTEQAKRKSEKAAKSRKSAPIGKKMHKHGAGPRYFLNIEYNMRGKTKKGTIYGLGSVQYKNSSASVLIRVSLKRNLDVDMRMSGFETTISEVKEDIAGVKEDFTALKTEINAFKTEVTGDVSKPSNSQHYSANCPISSFHSCLNCTTISASTSVTTSRSAPSSSSISTSATTSSSVYGSTTTSLDQYPF